MASTDISTPLTLVTSPSEAEQEASLHYSMEAAAIRACYAWAKQKEQEGVSAEEILKAIALEVLEEG